MKAKTSDLSKDIDEPITEGDLLLLRMYLDLGMLNAEMAKKAKEMKLPEFKSGYEKWYSVPTRIRYNSIIDGECVWKQLGSPQNIK